MLAFPKGSQQLRDAIDYLEYVSMGLQLPPSDLLLIGDGSGTVYREPAGWACAAYDRRKQQIHVHFGSLSEGTNNLAELAPFVQALWHHHQDHDQTPQLPVSVQIVSDSEVTIRCGSGVYARRANGWYWASIEWFERNGYDLNWKHVPRNSNPWNAWMDELSGALRERMQQAQRALLHVNADTVTGGATQSLTIDAAFADACGSSSQATVQSAAPGLSLA
jgi:ribonuclease HI